MASMAITSSLHIASSTHHVTKKQQPQSGTARSLGSKQVANVVTLDVEGQKGFNTTEHHVKSASYNEKSNNAKDEMEHGSDMDTGPCGPKFVDERWKNGTWDLNMFVHDGKMDWDGVIVAGRAVMVRLFMAYLVDAFTGLDVVGQTSNFICKAGLFVTVISVILLRRSEDFENMKKLADEATFYDKQWQASWRDQNVGALQHTGKKI